MVWVIFNDQRPPNNRKLKSKKWAQDANLQKTYNFYIEDDLLTKYNSIVKEEIKPIEKTIDESPIEQVQEIVSVEETVLKTKMGRPKKQTA